ncbi:MAG: hypothetical protein Q8J76_10985 [Desulfobulbaceae bacterium]|nr:hypothetical protein [Desulfobulbaceae bacterium]
MATNLYFRNTTAAEPKPNVKQSTTPITQWVGDSAAAITAKDMLTAIGDTTYHFVNYSQTEPGATHYAWFKSWISPPLNAQTISGTLSFIADFIEGAAAHNLMPRIFVYVWKADDSGIRGILYPNTNSAVEADTSAGTMQTFFNGVAITPVDCQKGDKIVIEVMSFDNNTRTVTYTHDLLFNGTVASNSYSYIRFSQDLSWYVAAAVPRSWGIII